MKYSKYLIAAFSLLLFMFSSATDGLSLWENLAISLSIYFLLDFLDNLGQKIVIMDLAVIMAAVTCLVMPVVFYHLFTKENPLAKLWGKYMPVSSDDYFSFVVPAVVAMAAGFRVKIGKLNFNRNPKAYMDNMKKTLEKKPKLGLFLISVGLVSGLLDFLSPASLSQVFFFMAHLTFVGAFYIIYSPNKYKRIIVPSVLALMIGQTLVTGMFGDFILMLACALVLILLGRKIRFYKKILVAVAGIFFILIIQSIKFEYREKLWIEGSGADPVYYAELVAQRIAQPSIIFNPDQLFFIGTRMNQGWLVATTMDRVPARFDFAYGETIWQSVAAAIVPRFLWPDKPEAGGKANLKRFWGYTLTGYSMNIGPFGEGYANFNVNGGILFMFFYGLFFNLMLSLAIKLAERRPTIILWIPFLFFYSIGVETDLLTTMGSLVKGIIFTWIVFRAFRIAFRIDL